VRDGLVTALAVPRREQGDDLSADIIRQCFDFLLVALDDGTTLP
jgi:hypothetical protein